MKDIDADYYGYRDEDDGILVPRERELEKKVCCLLLIQSSDRMLYPYIQTHTCNTYLICHINNLKQGVHSSSLVQGFYKKFPVWSKVLRFAFWSCVPTCSLRSQWDTTPKIQSLQWRLLVPSSSSLSRADKHISSYLQTRAQLLVCFSQIRSHNCLAWPGNNC